MKIALFCHSLISDWNHGNAHFLRGIVRELLERGHEVGVFEPAGGWSLTNLLKDHGPGAVEGFRLQVDADQDRWRGKLDYGYVGPQLYVTGRF